MAKIGEKIRSIRQQKELTQQQVADTLGVSRPLISRIERGDSVPSKPIVKIFALKYGVTERWLTT